MIASGLREGHEYTWQTSFLEDDGSRTQPDVVISLPVEKCLIIDAESACKCTEDPCSRVSLKELCRVLWNHYRRFLIMFVPVETAFSAASETSTHRRNYLLKHLLRELQLHRLLLFYHYYAQSSTLGVLNIRIVILDRLLILAGNYMFNSHFSLKAFRM